MSRGPDTLITPDIFRTVAKPSVEHFPARRSCLKTGFDFMIRYSSYRGTNYRTNPSAPTEPLCSVAREFRELQDLRERVKKLRPPPQRALGRAAEDTYKTMTKCAAVRKSDRRAIIRRPALFFERVRA